MFRALSLCLLLAAPALANGSANDSTGDTPGERIVDRPMDLVKDQILDFPELMEGRPHLQLESRITDAGELLVQISETGFADDSVAGKRERHFLVPTDDGRWSVQRSLTDYRCRRGDTGDKWVTGPCP